MGEVNLVWLSQINKVLIKKIGNKLNKPNETNSRISALVG